MLSSTSHLLPMLLLQSTCSSFAPTQSRFRLAGGVALRHFDWGSPHRLWLFLCVLGKLSLSLSLFLSPFCSLGSQANPSLKANRRFTSDQNERSRKGPRKGRPTEGYWCVFWAFSFFIPTPRPVYRPLPPGPHFQHGKQSQWRPMVVVVQRQREGCYLCLFSSAAPLSPWLRGHRFALLPSYPPASASSPFGMQCPSKKGSKRVFTRGKFSFP